MYKAYIPQSIVEGYYKGEGRFNGMKIKSKGFFNITAGELLLIGTHAMNTTNYNLFCP